MSLDCINRRARYSNFKSCRKESPSFSLTIPDDVCGV